jgi:hypothetical protein
MKTFVELLLVLYTLGLDLELLELLPGGPAADRALHQHHLPPVSQVAPSAANRFFYSTLCLPSSSHDEGGREVQKFLN